jgi:DNA-binding NtrC family response regulator
MTKPTVFIVEDDHQVAVLVAKMLATAGMESSSFGTGESAMAELCRRRPDAVLLDLMLPDTDGVQLLARINERAPGLPVVMMSGQGTVKAAVEALKLGAYDFLEKPIELNRLRTAVANALERSRLARQVNALQGELAGQYRMVGDSLPMVELRDLISRLAPTRATVLVTGESGSGKELVARALHLQSGRAAEPFVTLNCAAIPRELIESELFGHERGAFTGADASRIGKLASAEGGTFFLDEVGDMSLAAQAKMLRFIEYSEVQPLGQNETKRVDVRLVAATNRDLAAAVKAGEFREDLYHRLNVMAVRVPALRERPEDIEPLGRHFLDEFCRRHNRRVEFAPDCWDALRAHAWPGNVRELRNVVERAVVLGRKNPLGAAALREFIGCSDAAPAGRTLKDVVEQAERAAVTRALAESGGNVTTAAKLLGVERPSLHRIIRRLKLGG